MKEIYLDNAATTKALPEVVNKVKEALEKNYANPSSLHRLGIESEKMVKEARRNIADTFNIDSKELVFPGSGTIANNIAILGTIKRLKKFGKRIITSQIEHKSVLEIFKHLENEGFDVIYIPVNKNGKINIDRLKEVINKETILISIMAVNNEIGTVQPLKKIANIIKKYDNLYFHVDGVQALGKVPLDLKKLNIDLFTISSHKIHGPKGVGALYINNNILLDKIFYGSKQERGYYPGTENTPGIAGFGEAVKHLPNKDEIKKLYELRDLLADKIKNGIKEVVINTTLDDASAPHILNISFAGIKGEVLVHTLEKEGIYVSTGSACTSRKDSTSHVIKALHLPDKYKGGSIRFSLSQFNTKEEIEYTYDILVKSVNQLRRIMGGR